MFTTIKNTVILILSLLGSIIFGKDVTELNQSIGLKDSLANGKKIRIYKGIGISNYTRVFRMYQDSRGKWTAELLNKNNDGYRYIEQMN